MPYQMLDDYIWQYGSEVSKCFQKMLKEVWPVLDINSHDERYKGVKFYYYKKPFFDDTQDNNEREMIVFTDSGSFVRETLTCDSNNEIESINIEIFRPDCIEKVVLKSSAQIAKYDVTLEIKMKDGSIIKLTSKDSNRNWEETYAEHIKEIAKHLIASAK